MRRHIRKNQAGFSLLEMLIAVGIMSAAAYVALDTVENNTGQHRYELTELRAQKIRRAIVGDPNLVVNGSPAVSGFVADVGRLPDCLEALFVREPDCDDDGSALDDFHPPEYTRVSSGVTPTLFFGWRGPYLSGGLGGVPDGWGTSAPDVTVDALNVSNYGWRVVADAVGGTFDFESWGRDRADNAIIPDSYDDDQEMEGIRPKDFIADLASTNIKVRVSTGATARNVCLALMVPDESGTDGWKLVEGGLYSIPATSLDFDVSFVSSETIPIGMRPLLVYSADTTYTTGVSCSPSTAADRNNLVGSSDVAHVFARSGILFAPSMSVELMLKLSL